MTIAVTPHLNFRGDARAALEFYRSAFGGDLVIVTYGDLGRADDPSDAAEVVWGQVAAADGSRVMAYDVPAAMPWEPGANAFFVSVRGDTAGEVAGYWERLSAGGTVLQPLAPSAWSALYGMVRDRFGVTWVLDVAVPDVAGGGHG